MKDNKPKKKLVMVDTSDHNPKIKDRGKVEGTYADRIEKITLETRIPKRSNRFNGKI